MDRGTVTVINSTLTGNKAIGLYGEGGGIWNRGTATLIKSTLSGNEADGSGLNEPGGAGGGVYNTSGGTLIVIDSTFSGNSTNVYGGGIWTGSTFSGSPNKQRCTGSIHWT